MNLIEFRQDFVSTKGTQQKFCLKNYYTNPLAAATKWRPAAWPMPGLGCPTRTLFGFDF